MILHMDITEYTEIRLLVFFAAEDGEACTVWELTVAQIMSSLLQNSDLN